MDYTGTSGDDSIRGTAQADHFVTNGGNDTFSGGGGDDILVFNATGTLVFSGGGGFDTLDVSQLAYGSNWMLSDDFEGFVGGRWDDYASCNDMLLKHARALDGGAGDDHLGGGGAGDTLVGGKGADTLEGFFGADALTGGKGADSFVFRAGWDYGDGVVRTDLITDLENTDCLVFDVRVKLDDIQLSYDAHRDLTTIAVDVDHDGTVDLTIRAAGDHTDYPLDRHHVLVF